MKLLLHDGLRKYAANTLWLLTENVLRLISGLILGVIVIRHLGLEQYGITSYVIAYVAIFGSIAKIGLDSIVVRNLINNPDKKDTYLGTAFWLKIIGGCLSVALISIVQTLSSSDSNIQTYVLIVSVGLILQCFEVIDLYFQSIVKSKYVSISKIIQLLISAMLRVYLISVGASLVWFVAVYLAEQVIISTALYITYNYKYGNKFIFQFDAKIAKNYLGESWPIILIGFSIALQSKVDQLIIGGMLGTFQLGLYAVAVGIIEIVSFIPMIVNSSISPAIINAKKRSNDQYNSRLKSYYALSFVLFLVIGIPIALFGEKIVTILYGQDFKSAGIILSLLSLRIFFANIGVARSVFILNERLFKFNLLATIIGAATSVVLNYALIPIYGLYGAIVASYMSFFVSTFLFDIFHPKTRENLIFIIQGIFSPYKLIYRYVKPQANQ